MDTFFALVELFGHQKIAGTVSDCTVGSASFVRVDVPAIGEREGFTRMFNPSAIYGINPVTEDTMLALASSLRSTPVVTWDVAQHYAHLKLKDRPAVEQYDGEEDWEGSEEEEELDF